MTISRLKIIINLSQYFSNNKKLLQLFNDNQRKKKNRNNDFKSKSFS